MHFIAKKTHTDRDSCAFLWTRRAFLCIIPCMANILSTEKKIAAVGMLCEGNSIRSIERMTGVHRDTVMRLGVRMGEGCQRIMDEKMKPDGLRDCRAVFVRQGQPPWRGILTSLIDGSSGLPPVNGSARRRGRPGKA